MSRKRGKNGSTFDPILTHAAKPVKMGIRGHFVPFLAVFGKNWQNLSPVFKLCSEWVKFLGLTQRLRNGVSLGIYFSLFRLFYFTTIFARFEEVFCIGAGNAVHIDVAGAQKRQVSVSHIQLKAWQIGVAFCVEACVCVPKDVLNPASAKARIVPNFTPSALPVCRADIRRVFGFVGN